jgi:acyl-CoA thioesterase FadM
VHLIFRTILAVLRARFASRLGHYDVSRSRFRVLPTDLDVNRHLNNGVYLSIADLGRFELLIRSGIWRIVSARGWYPVVVAETISFRKSLAPWQRFEVESRVLGFDDKAVYVEQRFVVAGEIYAQLFVRGRFLKRKGGVVPIPELIEAIGGVPDDLALPDWLVQWGADTALPGPRAPAPRAGG